MPSTARKESVSPPPPTPQDYARLFDGSELGKRVFEDLVRKFSRPPVYKDGIDGIRISDFRAGARSVVEHIVRRINQASGVNDVDPEE